MTELKKAYEPHEAEKKWYTFWEDSGYFKADAHSDKPPYCLVLPPPNVTGVLHMGHALVDTLQDVIARWKRMCGYETLWLPGTDHAGISTQTVVERHLINKYGKRRKDFSRDAFLEHVWKWKNKSETEILNQIKKLGCSCDWSRHRFTLDKPLEKAVKTMFKKLFDKGLIIQKDYLVNWDPVTQTALADDEVEYEEKASYIWHFRYPITNSNESIVIATTRPETMLGDTAVAVNPKDERYTHLVGKTVTLPLVGREIPIIADRYVDKDFGTGALKVTPAHDPNDYMLGELHNLPMINIMTVDGKINEICPQFEGMTMHEARKAVVHEMHELRHLVKREPHTNRVGVSYRSKAVIEPFLSKQWFIDMSAFKEKMKQAVTSGAVKLVPDHWNSTYFHWIDNLRDWCISRQLWWGHRIPIWHNTETGEMVCYDGEGDPPEVTKNPGLWEQEEDVLDTWFSSALWPFSTLGWPDKTPDLAKFYPNQTLVTGHDILFFWVARMIMMGEAALDDVPFQETFLHGLIYGKSYWRESDDGHIAYVTPDEKRSFDQGEKLPKDVHSKWEKMSKSKGNVIDPIEMIDKYGADAVRFALTASTTYARQIDLDQRRFEEYKNFANKVWNGARFVLMNLGDTPLSGKIDHSLLQLEDKWLLSRLNKAIKSVNDNLDKYAFDHASMGCYTFFWDVFCAYYVEMAKPILFGKVGTDEIRENKRQILLSTLVTLLKLLHPFAPFITEELYQTIKKTHKESVSDKACIIASYPLADKTLIDEKAEEEFAFLEKIVHTIRNIRAEMQLPPSAKTEIYFSGDHLKAIKDGQAVIKSLVPVTEIYLDKALPKGSMSAHELISGLNITLPLPQELIAKEKKRLEKEIISLEKQVASLEGQLANPNFVERAPEALVKKTKQSLLDLEERLEAAKSKQL